MCLGLALCVGCRTCNFYSCRAERRELFARSFEVLAKLQFGACGETKNFTSFDLFLAVVEGKCPIEAGRSHG